MAPSQIEIAQPPADAITAIAFAPQTPTRFLASSWSKSVYLYDLTGGEDGGNGCLLGEFEHPAPVLSVCFGEDDNEAFTGCMDRCVRRLDLTSGELTLVTKHGGAPSSKVAYSREYSLLLSTSWDSSLHVVSPGSGSGALIINLPAKPFALALSPSKAVVAMSSRLLNVYTLSSLAAGVKSGQPVEPWQQRESSLKFMTRSVSCMPSDLGYATSSVEGRVAVEWFDSSAESQAKKYAFKCHRTSSIEKSEDGKEETIDLVYPVNALAFHPVHGTFASGGGDGTVALWDAEAKRRMKQYQKFPDSVHCLAFSSNGKYLAVAVAPGFEDGSINEYDARDGRTRLFVRELGENEAKGKTSK